MPTSPKRSAREVKAELERLVEQVELEREQAEQQGLTFTAPTPDELEKKLRGETSNSPTIVGQSFTSGPVPRGSTAIYNVTIYNPDPVAVGNLFVTVFWGTANFFEHAADMIIGRDSRWPYLASGPFSLFTGTNAQRNFNYTTPSAVPASTYTGNCVLWQASIHDIGRYLDRSMSWITLS